jgi:predicted metal-dependent hydrolase
VVRKRITNLNLTVQPPDGRVRVSVPYRISDDRVRQFVLSKRDWIKKHQANVRSRPRPTRQAMISGESYDLWGKRYRLEVIERQGRHEVQINKNHMYLYVKPNTTKANRQKALVEFYRAEIKGRVPSLIAKWEAITGERVFDWGVKQMKTRWGSCNTRARRIWLNLELAKKPPECLEYILVHEMVHLLERRHNQKFRSYMDRFMPNWRATEQLLKRPPDREISGNH